tara:strand:+ start:137 stop:1102 length:966 start_codon:yes stop_codon:yes gene_type:complete
MSQLYGEKIFDWKKVLDIPLDGRKAAIIGAMNHFIKGIGGRPLNRVNGSKFSGSDPNLMSQAQVALVQSDTVKSPDRGYEFLFDEVDMRQSTNNSFDVLDVTGGVTFYQQDEGEEAKLSVIPSSAKSTVSMLRFTGGFNILDDWLRFNQYYKIDQLAADTLRRWWDKKATIFYSLISALSGINEAYDSSDIRTINNACANILTDLADAGYVVDENSRFAIVCNPVLRSRIFKAVAASFVNPNSNNDQIVYNIDTVISTTKMANTHYWVGLPGGRNQRGEWEDLNLKRPQRNELVLGETHISTGAYNGIIGQKKQFRKCALA